jgi:ferredoxin
MPTIVFEGKRNKVVVEAPDGGALVDLVDQNNAPVPFSCRSASCATCRIHVLEGANLFTDPEDEELAILDVFGADPSEQRLACQAKLRPIPGKIRIRAENEE